MLKGIYIYICIICISIISSLCPFQLLLLLMLQFYIIQLLIDYIWRAALSAAKERESIINIYNQQINVIPDPIDDR